LNTINQVAYSDVEGWTGGTGNIAPTANIESTPRDAAPDTGAGEWAGLRIFLPLTLRNS
jgi:hypothetical protein